MGLFRMIVRRGADGRFKKKGKLTKAEKKKVGAPKCKKKRVSTKRKRKRKRK